MYIPEINRASNKGETIAFMQQFSFATIVTSKDNLPVASHLPFLVTAKDDNVILTSHFAKANKQWEDIENERVLVIFSEPHAYISPGNYEKELNVPTWNYIAVHAYGRGKLITEAEAVFNVLESTINNYEISYRQQWDNLPADYKLKMSKGIVAFEIVVEDLQAKKKLSQNKTEAEKEKIIDSLSKSKNSNEVMIAEYMKKEKIH
jgi:transcriptional regulator